MLGNSKHFNKTYSGFKLLLKYSNTTIKFMSFNYGIELNCLVLTSRRDHGTYITVVTCALVV